VGEVIDKHKIELISRETESRGGPYISMNQLEREIGTTTGGREREANTLAKLAGMARMSLTFITCEIKMLKNLAESRCSRMPEPSMPQVSRGSGV
jgi:hypothetical protein